MFINFLNDYYQKTFAENRNKINKNKIIFKIINKMELQKNNTIMLFKVK